MCDREGTQYKNTHKAQEGKRQIRVAKMLSELLQSKAGV